MITSAVANFFLGLTAGLIGLVPGLSDDALASLDDFDGSIGSLFAQVAKLGPIIPFDDIALAAFILSAFLVIALAFQIGRVVLSFVTLGGGSV